MSTASRGTARVGATMSCLDEVIPLARAPARYLSGKLELLMEVA